MAELLMDIRILLPAPAYILPGTVFFVYVQNESNESV